MQFFTLIGGFLGFTLVLVVSLIAAKPLEEAVFNATLGCVLTAFLFRGFRMLLEHCARQVVAEKTRLRDEQASAENTPSPPTEEPQAPPAQTPA
jgi:hypothetical protein